MHNHVTLVLTGALLSLSLLARAGTFSNRECVFLDPAPSSFWHTATNNVLELPIDFPSGAKSAELIVTGQEYHQVYQIAAPGSFVLELPEAVSPGTENVYDLELSFDVGDARRARLGLVRGSGKSAGTTRCLLVNEDSRKWYRLAGRAVLPIPYGTVSFTVDGVETDTGLGRDQGWYAFGPLQAGMETELCLATAEETYVTRLLGFGGAFMLIIR